MFVVFHTLCVGTRALFLRAVPLSTCCVWMGRLFALESVCLHSCARHWCHNPAGTTHVVRPCFEGRSGRRLHVVTDVVLRGLPLPSKSLAGQANPLSAVPCRTSATSDSYGPLLPLLTRHLGVSGCHSTNSAFC